MAEFSRAYLGRRTIVSAKPLTVVLVWAVKVPVGPAAPIKRVPPISSTSLRAKLYRFVMEGGGVQVLTVLADPNKPNTMALGRVEVTDGAICVIVLVVAV
jgi:hypothetical protein